MSTWPAPRAHYTTARSFCQEFFQIFFNYFERQVFQSYPQEINRIYTTFPLDSPTPRHYNRYIFSRRLLCKKKQMSKLAQLKRQSSKCSKTKALRETSSTHFKEQTLRQCSGYLANQHKLRDFGPFFYTRQTAFAPILPQPTNFVNTWAQIKE